jgi:ElaB/YqjD/DUF883 family membrane-anchored ribosome-binding protein
MAIRNPSQETKDKSTEVKASAISANEVKEKVQDLASAASQKVQDVAADVTHKAQDWASKVANKAQETASAAVGDTNEAIAKVGHQMNMLGGTVRETAPRDGVIGSGATTVADKLQAAGGYLEGHGLQAMSKDLSDVVRNYPIQSVLVVFGIGCLVGMTLRRSQSMSEKQPC